MFVVAQYKQCPFDPIPCSAYVFVVALYRPCPFDPIPCKVNSSKNGYIPKTKQKISITTIEIDLLTYTLASISRLHQEMNSVKNKMYVREAIDSVDCSLGV